MKFEVNSRRFANAWEAVSIVAAEDSARPALDSAALAELYEGHGLRLVSTDGYVIVRAWVPLDDEGDNMEPEIAELPDESFIVKDEDGRGLGLLKYVRKLHKKEPDEGCPALLVTRQQEETDQGVLEGLEAELLHISWPLHEDVALTLVEAEFPDWRNLTNDRVTKGAKEISFTSVTLGALAKLGDLYKGYTIDWTLRGNLGIIDFKIGPLSGHLMPARRLMPSPGDNDA